MPDGVEVDGNIAYMVIGIAGKNGTHLNMLSHMALICADEENIEKMKKATTKKSWILKNI